MITFDMAINKGYYSYDQSRQHHNAGIPPSLSTWWGVSNHDKAKERDPIVSAVPERAHVCIISNCWAESNLTRLGL